jgi:hypothetical protein
MLILAGSSGKEWITFSRIRTYTHPEVCRVFGGRSEQRFPESGHTHTPRGLPGVRGKEWATFFRIRTHTHRGLPGVRGRSEQHFLESGHTYTQRLNTIKNGTYSVNTLILITCYTAFCQIFGSCWRGLVLVFNYFSRFFVNPVWHLVPGFVPP